MPAIAEVPRMTVAHALAMGQFPATLISVKWGSEGWTLLAVLDLAAKLVFKRAALC